MILYRPVGLLELGLVFDRGMKGFPPRLPEQPIFYPVTNFGYASQIARQWNATSGNLAGYVTAFTVTDAYVSGFKRRIVGGREHEELWVPAEELEMFNNHIEGFIEVDAAYFGNGFIGVIPDSLGLKGKNAIDQFTSLLAVADYSGMDFFGETYAQRRIIYLHYPFWRQHDFSDVGITKQEKDDLLRRIEKRWELSNIPFGLPRLRKQGIEDRLALAMVE